MSTTAKTVIEALVAQYKRTFPVEWESFKSSMKQKRLLALDRFGEVKHSDLVDRKIHEMPETLFTIFDMKLSKEDMEWFKTKEGARWFVKKYPEFSSSEKI